VLQYLLYGRPFACLPFVPIHAFLGILQVSAQGGIYIDLYNNFLPPFSISVDARQVLFHKRRLS
jgi:hypothetical protein